MSSLKCKIQRTVEPLLFDLVVEILDALNKRRNVQATTCKEPEGGRWLPMWGTLLQSGLTCAGGQRSSSSHKCPCSSSFTPSQWNRGGNEYFHKPNLNNILSSWFGHGRCDRALLNLVSPCGLHHMPQMTWEGHTSAHPGGSSGGSRPFQLPTPQGRKRVLRPPDPAEPQRPP